MQYENGKIGGVISLYTSSDPHLAEIVNQPLYRFLYVMHGTIVVNVNYLDITISEGEVLVLTDLHDTELKSADGSFAVLSFNSSFYCIYGNDHEVSCSGVLFHGTSHQHKLKLTADTVDALNYLINALQREFAEKDNLREEVLRIMLKHFIIICTRIVRAQIGVDVRTEQGFDLVRQFYVLVDKHFKEKKQVQNYAELLHKSPKTLTNQFAEYDLPSPIQIIHQRIASEAKLLLSRTDKSASEIAYALGYDDLSSFSRFFKKMSGKSITDFKKEVEASRMGNIAQLKG